MLQYAPGISWCRQAVNVWIAAVWRGSPARLEPRIAMPRIRCGFTWLHSAGRERFSSIPQRKSEKIQVFQKTYLRISQSRMYALVEQKLMAGENIILDGGTGTEIQRRGVPMHHQVWCAEANVTHPDVVRAVHCDYLRAGAEVITANTFATSPLLFNAVKRDRDIREFDRIAVRLVREAVEEAAIGAPV